MAEAPFVSVIVPMRNEERFIERCLRSLLDQDYPTDRFEVIVVDGASDDGSRAIAERLQPEFASMHIVDNRGKHTSRGLNIGLAYAKGDIIARLDGHAVASPDFLSESVAALQRTNADVVGGPIKTLGESGMGETVAIAMSSQFGVGNATFRYSQEEDWTDTVAFPAYRRDVFDRFGTFAEIEAGEDDEFHYRLRDGDARILLTPAIRSTYYGRQSLFDLAKQYFAYGQAKVVVLTRHPRRTRLRQLAPACLVIGIIGAAITSIFGGLMLLPLAILGGLYIGVSLGFSMGLARRYGWAHALRLPFAFAAMHFSYGIGFIAGFVRRMFGQQVAVQKEAEAR
jgi:succinoglycan biosynthesis protein ExoA